MTHAVALLLLLVVLTACRLPHTPAGCHKAVRNAIYGRNECVMQTI